MAIKKQDSRSLREILTGDKVDAKLQSQAVDRLIHRIQDLSAVSADFGNIMEALPPVARVPKVGVNTLYTRGKKS